MRKDFEINGCIEVPPEVTKNVVLLYWRNKYFYNLKFYRGK